MIAYEFSYASIAFSVNGPRGPWPRLTTFRKHWERSAPQLEKVSSPQMCCDLGELVKINYLLISGDLLLPVCFYDKFKPVQNNFSNHR